MNCSSFVVPFLSAATHFSFSSALTRMIAECMALSFFADSSLFWSICALLSHHSFCCTSLVSASLAILGIAMSTHSPCFTIACGPLTSRVLPLLFFSSHVFGRMVNHCARTVQPVLLGFFPPLALVAVVLSIFSVLWCRLL